MSFMQKVSLFVRDTSPKNFVVSGRIPPFQTGAPDVVIWGERFFKYHSDVFDDDKNRIYCYVEAFTVALVDFDESRPTING